MTPKTKQKWNEAERINTNQNKQKINETKLEKKKNQKAKLLTN